MGTPVVAYSSVTTLGHVKATIKRGNHRGLLYRDVSYELHFFTHASRMSMFPRKEAVYAIWNDRVYHMHVPRKIVAGINILKKELKLSVSRPAYDKPLQILMHSQTSVMARGHNVKGDLPSLKASCPSCSNVAIISTGADAAKGRVFLDKTNKNMGAYIHGEYFDCEMDISKGNTVKHFIGAFLPYNKNPRWTKFDSLVS